MMTRWFQLRCGYTLKFLVLVSAMFCAPLASANEELPVKATMKLVPIEQATDIRAQPLSILAKFPEGGGPMAQYIAKAIIGDPTLVDPILSVAADASPQQAAAIGAGLVRGARALEAEHPEAARMIAEKVVKCNNLRVMITFQSIGPGYVLEADLKPLADAQNALANADDTGLANRRLLQKPNDEIEAFEHRDDSKETYIPPLRPDNEFGRNGLGGGDNLTQLQKNELLARHGTIIAILASDAAHNGAVSTSPTR